MAAIASTLTALGVLAAPAFVPAPSSADRLTFPYVHHFDTGAGGTLSGDATVAGGRLRLTDQVAGQAGAWSTDDTFPSDIGLEIEFRYAMHNDVGDVGADGLLLFLADGAAPQGVGAYGAALGYACRSSLTQGGDLPCDLPGVPGGFAAVALDRYGNFSRSINQSGPGQAPDSVVVRGSGDGTTGYRYVDGEPLPGGVATDGSSTRKVRVSLLPGAAGELAMTVRVETDGALRTVLDRVPLHLGGQTALPETLRLGFSAATGSHVDVHEVDELQVWQPADLAVEHDLPLTVAAGGEVSYTVTAHNVGPNASDPSRLAVDVPQALQDVTWTCSAPAGSACASDAGSGDVDVPVTLPRDGAATVTVTGQLPAGATGELESVATIATPPGLADVDETDNVSRASAEVTDAPAPVARITTDKSVDPVQVRPGDEVEYTVTVHNAGPATAQDVGAVDDLPDAMRFVRSDDGCAAEGQRVTCSSDEPLAPGGERAFHLRAVLDPTYTGDGSDVENVATGTSPTDPDGGDPSPGVVVEVTGPGDGDHGGGGDDGDGDGDHGGGGDGGGSGDGGGDGGDGGGTGDGDGGEPGAGTDGGGTGGPGHVGAAGPGSLAYTGAEGLGVLAALAAGAAGLGGLGWWVLRRRSLRRATELPVD